MFPQWSVQILYGYTEIDVTAAPVRFGPPTVTLHREDDGSTSASEARNHLVYGPVLLRSVDNSLWIEVYEEPQPAPGGGSYLPRKTVREMKHVLHTEWDDWGTVRITGLEAREDGVMVEALWEVEPYFPDESDDEPASDVS